MYFKVRLFIYVLYFRRTESAVEELRISNYLRGLLNTVSSTLQGRKVVEIVCFGLGHLSECNISKYQLALLLCMKDHFKPHKVLTHDPIFYKGECEVLSKLGCDVITENSEGSYVIDNNNPSIIYFPHCPKQLTNNFLWSNWGSNLENCILICNSFNSLTDNNPSRILSESVPYIYKIFPYTSEEYLENNFKFTDIFNDTSVHHFPKHSLKTLDSNFWKKDIKPVYENTEEFITSLMIQKLNI